MPSEVRAEEKPNETADRIKREAMLVVSRHGGDDLTVEDVARRVDVDPARAKECFGSRDALLTALILDAYHAMGDSAEKGARQAEESGGSHLERWIGVCRGVREWAVANPRQFALVWGPPLSGYDAPMETMEAGGRTPVALIAIVREAVEEGVLQEHALTPPLNEAMKRNVEILSSSISAGLPDIVIARMNIAWTQLLGMSGFAVYGHIAGVAADPVAFFEHAAAAMGEYVGLRH
ncbi:TetR/AcrR family transcriptional regulator [Streptomyces sp. NPDC088190]|uniref:TetR/AcrR family transcriptional regulator n=1 Tax=unclassified Streptomyces TaxID=2593676 RepID=UPI002E77273D|nr:TetR-like C-terminal domain-containing protein [Streptomyces sp. JV190]MEE1845215.1 TetR-like C-terminal domain-containing protein [Streptomyces sp. JV190]